MTNRNEVITALAQRLLTEQRNAPLVVGISGGYASGKTRLVDDLAATLKQSGQSVQVVHYDDFHRPLATITWPDDDPQAEVTAFYQRAFDADKLCREVLTPLRTTGSLHTTLAVLDWGKGANVLPLTLNIDPTTIVLLEGMLLFRSPVAQYLDVRVFIQVSEATILARGRQRDVPRFGPEIMTLYHQRYLPVLRRYLAQDHPELGAIVIQNDDYQHPALVN